MNESVKTFLAYLACIGACSFYLYEFLARNRCFVREAGKEYPSGYGVDRFEAEDHGTLGCYIDYLLSGKFIMLPVFMLAVVIYLIRDHAQSMKVIVFFVCYAVPSLGYLEWITIQDNSIIGSGGK